MNARLRITAGQHTDKGRKPRNQDFHGICLPAEPLLSSKGIAVALADGIGSSEVSHIASESAVAGFLEDYYCTSEAWPVKKSASRVLTAVNSWLHAQSGRSPYRYDKDKGYVCTFSAIVLKSTTAHLFHLGDARVYRAAEGGLEQLTRDHRYWVSREESYLSRALGMNPHLEIDYRALTLEAGDTFVLATDGVYEYVPEERMLETLANHTADLDAAARGIVEDAHARGSPDNLTVQIVRIEEVPDGQAGELHRQLDELQLPPLLQARMEFDGYRILRDLHASSRSHVHLAQDIDTGEMVALKTPSIDCRGDKAYLERFLTEEWIARRVNSPHVLQCPAPARKRRWLYTVSEYVEGQTLRQWMIDHPRPPLEAVRDIVDQIARGLRAFHRLEMLHQDLRPENVMIDSAGTVKIIDFGAVLVAGLSDDAGIARDRDILGTAAYSAPEYFLGDQADPRADLFSLGVLTYEMLCGALPYGTEIAKTKSRKSLAKLRYQALPCETLGIPPWIDAVLRRAVQPLPHRRHEALSEFVHGLRHPDPAFVERRQVPLMERDPVRFWQALCVVLMAAVILLLLDQGA